MKPQILEGSRAIALTIKNIRPSVVSAYPITPQTHIVEDLARFKLTAKLIYEYVRAESELPPRQLFLVLARKSARLFRHQLRKDYYDTGGIFNIAEMRLRLL